MLKCKALGVGGSCVEFMVQEPQLVGGYMISPQNAILLWSLFHTRGSIKQFEDDKFEKQNGRGSDSYTRRANEILVYE